MRYAQDSSDGADSETDWIHLMNQFFIFSGLVSNVFLTFPRLFISRTQYDVVLIPRTQTKHTWLTSIRILEVKNFHRHRQLRSTKLLLVKKS